MVPGRKGRNTSMKKTISAAFLSIVTMFALQGCSSAPPARNQATDPAGNFYLVSDGLYRGGRPDEAGVAQLAQMGVKTIVNLENDQAAIDQERTWAQANNLQFVSAPMNGM